MELVFAIMRFIDNFLPFFIVLFEIAVLPISTVLIYKKQFDGITSPKSNSGKQLNAAIFGIIIYVVCIIDFLLSIFMYYLYIQFY